LVLISTGLLAELTPEELKGVLMHEYSHIKNRDTVILPLLFLTGVPIAYWILSSSPHSSFFIIFLVAYYVSLSLLFKAIELRADIYATRKVGGDVYSKTIVKLEYPRLIRHETAVTKILNLLNIASYPLPTQRLHAVEHSHFIKGHIFEMIRFLLS
jgi:Zn-dependent protease with chaperone function